MTNSFIQISTAMHRHIKTSDKDPMKPYDVIKLRNPNKG